MAKSPAFQFYPAEYLSSEKATLLTLVQEGIYIRALSHCWLNETIPSDPETLCRQIQKGATVDDVKIVMQLFVPDNKDSTRLRHVRLDEERKKQRNWNKKSKEGGQKSAQRREAKRLEKSKGGSTTVATTPPTTVATTEQPKVNSLSLSLSLSSSSLKEVKEKGLNLKVAFLKNALAVLYDRGPTDPWTYAEEHGIVEVIARPNLEAECVTIRDFKAKIPPPEIKFHFPKSAVRLVTAWSETLDAARTYQSPQSHANGQPTAFTLTTKADAIREEMKILRRDGGIEVATGFDWTDQTRRKKCQELALELKTIKEQMRKLPT